MNKPIATKIDGVRICELLPELAKIGRQVLDHPQHDARHLRPRNGLLRHADRAAGRAIGRSIRRSGRWSRCSADASAGYKGLIPPYIVLTEPQGRFSEAGFLGIRYKPFATGGDPSQARFVVEGIVAQNVSDQRQKVRRELLEELNTLKHADRDDPRLASLQDSDKQAYDLILGDAGKVFDLSQEKDDLRDRYGRNRFGQSCLLARRLVQRGVPYITINYPGWDTHKENFQVMRRKLPETRQGHVQPAAGPCRPRAAGEHDRLVDAASSAARPKSQWEAPWNGGRNHWGKVFSAVVAGGGFKGGQVVGASDAKGEEVKDRPVYPCDLIGSMYELLGIDTAATLPHPLGLVARVTPAPEDKVPSGGRLKEIM